MNYRVKIAVLIVALLVAATGFGLVTYLTGTNGISANEAGAKIEAQFNAHDSNVQIVKILKCVKGTHVGEWICAATAYPTAEANLYAQGLGAMITSPPTCGVVEAVVTAKQTQIVAAVTDPAACIFA